MATLLLDRGLIEEIRRIERATGRDDVLSGFVRELEGNLAGFGAAFSDCIARGDATGAVRATFSWLIAIDGGIPARRRRPCPGAGERRSRPSSIITPFSAFCAFCAFCAFSSGISSICKIIGWSLPS